MADQNTARLIAEMFEALSWRPRINDCADHPVLGPAIALRERVYSELRGKDFTTARIASDTAAIQFIIDSEKEARPTDQTASEATHG